MVLELNEIQFTYPYVLRFPIMIMDCFPAVLVIIILWDELGANPTEVDSERINTTSPNLRFYSSPQDLGFGSTECFNDYTPPSSTKDAIFFDFNMLYS
jgi:hypothetical protein